LEDKLFYLNPILRETLLFVRAKTYKMMESSRFIVFEPS
jgi:dynein heavy chain